MTYQIRTLPEAERQARSLADWWRNNRPAVPELVKEELQRAFRMLTQTPHIGTPYRRTRVSGVRRYLLRKTPYHVYYRINQETEEIIVMSVWSSMRKRGPSLKAR